MPSSEAVDDVKVPCASSTITLEVMTLPVTDCRGVLKYSKPAIVICSSYSPFVPLSRPNTDMLTMLPEGKEESMSCQAQPYSCFFRSFA